MHYTEQLVMSLNSINSLANRISIRWRTQLENQKLAYLSKESLYQIWVVRIIDLLCDNFSVKNCNVQAVSLCCRRFLVWVRTSLSVISLVCASTLIPDKKNANICETMLIKLHFSYRIYIIELIYIYIYIYQLSACYCEIHIYMQNMCYHFTKAYCLDWVRKNC